MTTTLQRSIEFLRPYVQTHVYDRNLTPLFVGVSGPQGSGKTTISRKLTQELAAQFPTLQFVTFSMDDFYFTYNEQLKVIEDNPGNVLVNGRGLPGTHDVGLLLNCLEKLKTRQDVDIPSYDKSQHGGKGDREPADKWMHIRKSVDVVIFEGWFNGYPAYSKEVELKLKWKKVKFEQRPAFDQIRDQDVSKLNTDLTAYHKVWDYFDTFVCITTNSLDNVYVWRMQQEHALIKEKGTGMSDDQVREFVDRYMPAYRLYYDRLDQTCREVPGAIKLRIDLERQLVTDVTF